MKITVKSWIGFATALILSISGLTPAQAVPTPVTLGNSNCDFSAVGQGHGSASDPFLVGSGLDLQELSECQSRNKTISNATVNGNGTVTFTLDSTHGSYGEGQVVNVVNTDGNLLDAENVKVVSSTDTSVTIKMVATLLDTTANGYISAEYTHVKLNADIDLSTPSTESWNNNKVANITAATKNSDGTVTFTAANSFQSGEDIFIDGMGDASFNIGMQFVNTATATEFTTSTNGYNLADGTATTAGGKAHSQGWAPVSLGRTEFDGANHTISGLSIYRNSSNQGLFGVTEMAVIKNLTVTDSVVNTTNPDTYESVSHTGILAGDLFGVTLKNVAVTSSVVIAGGEYAGLITGELEKSSATDINVDGLVTVGVTSNTVDNINNEWQYYGGVAGYAQYITMVNVSSSATVDGSSFAQDQNTQAAAIPAIATFYEKVGGVLGYASRLTGRNIVASGDIRGRRFVGGVIGEGRYDGELVNSSASGNVVGTTSDTPTWGEVAYIGGFAGRLNGESDNNNLSATGNVTVTVPANSNVEAARIGGLAGYINCCGLSTGLSSSGTVTVNMLGGGEVYSVGGLLGENDCCQAIVQSSSTSDVNVHSVDRVIYGIGGFVGRWDCCGVDRQNSASGDVSVTIDDPGVAWAYQIGGYAGFIDGEGTMNNIDVSGNVTVTKGYQIGGFGGYAGNSMSFRDINVTGNVTDTYTAPDEVQFNMSGNANVGGFIGWLNGHSAIERVSVINDVSVTGVNDSIPRNVGGIIGGISGDEQGTVDVRKSFFKGSVSGGNYVAGLIGYGERYNSYDLDGNLVVATVTASATNAVVDPVMNSFHVDTNGNNFVNSTLAGTSENKPEFNAATTADLKLEATFAAKGWTFTGNSPWRIDGTTNDGYPYLTIPGNDDTRTSGGTTIVDRVVERVVERVVDRVVDRVVEKTVTKKIVYKTVKSLTFLKKAIRLTKAQKQRIKLAAKIIAKSKYTSFVISASPSTADVSITSARATKVQEYLVAELKKLKSKKVVGISLTPKTSKASKNILIKQGK